MKCFYYLLLGVWLLSGCSAYKVASSEMNNGKYADAFETSIKLFKRNASQKKKDKQLVLLQNSYLKANEEDEQDLNQLKVLSQPNYKSIYYKTLSLYNRNNAIKPLLPLYNNGKELKFPYKNYTGELAVAKENYLNQYYTIALDLLGAQNKSKAREAYQYLTEIKGVDKSYKDVNTLQKEAYNQGADIIFVTTTNKTGVPFPADFKDNLLYSLNSSVSDFWTVITTNSSDPRDYEVDVVFRQAFVGNDILSTNTYNYEKEIVDGWDYLRDRRGNIIRDSLGNTTRVDKYVTVRARVIEYVRHKEAMLSAEVQVYNSFTGSLMNTYPIASNFAFNASFATLEGDRRALGSDIMRLVDTTPVPFPNNYDMISQCGVEIKRKLITLLDTFN